MAARRVPPGSRKMAEGPRAGYIAGPMNLKGLLAVSLAATALSLGGPARLPEGWSTLATMDAPQWCRAEVQGGWAERGNTLVLRCRAAQRGIYAVTQAIGAEAYRGRRVMLRARMRAQGLQGRAGLLLQAETLERRVLAMDDMRLNPVSGSTGWVDARVLLDVDAQAEFITLGVAVEGGPGAAWIDALRFEVVQADDPGLAVIVRPAAPSLPTRPQNLELR